MNTQAGNGQPESDPGLGLIDAVMAETLGIAMHNAVAAQNNMRMMGAAAVTAACVRMIKASGGVRSSGSLITVHPPRGEARSSPPDPGSGVD